tara:strand:- start:23 stop:616 length:594 start_codon:yes stop_codon:yes gene_type:complete
VDENYSIQAKNLLDNLVGEYKSSITSIHKIDIVVKQIKTIRIEVNKRSRWISEVSNLSKDIANKKVRILIYNEEYFRPIEKELESLELRFFKNGQFLDVIQPNFSYNQLMSLVDDIESKKNKIISKCTKAKMDPVIRSKHAVENEFIDHAIARKTSNNCQKMFEEYEAIIFEITLKKIKSILGHENFKKFEKEGFLD